MSRTARFNDERTEHVPYTAVIDWRRTYFLKVHADGTIAGYMPVDANDFIEFYNEWLEGKKAMILRPDSNHVD